MLKQICGMGLEGIVSKRRRSTYDSDRTDSWRKATCRIRETLIVTGYALKDGHFDGTYLSAASRTTNWFTPARSSTAFRRATHVT